MTFIPAWLTQVQDKFQQLKEAYPGDRLLVVSNRVGTPGHLEETLEVERTTGTKVLRHLAKKPGCTSQVLGHFRGLPETYSIKPNEIAVIGDRLLTDVMLANLLGACSFWIRDGVEIAIDPVSFDKSTADEE